jgi:hypothetical protein
MTRAQALDSIAEIRDMVRCGRPGVVDELFKLEEYFWSSVPLDAASLGESPRSVGIAAVRRQALGEHR